MNTPAARAVNCTQCGAPLQLNGGHRVRSLNCGFCGAVLDARDEYKVVQQFKHVIRPPMPLQLGMQGRIKDVDFTIIGVVQYRDAEGYQWLEYQLFSPTHGYHWLNCSNGHFVFSRRVRDMPRIGAKQKATFKVKDRTFKVYESYQAKVIFVEGELTYVASVGDTVRAVEGIAPPFIFSRERTGTEEEYQLGEYLPHDAVYAAFGITSPPRAPSTIHGAQPYVPGAFATGLSQAGKWFAAPALLIALGILVFGNGSERLRESINPQQYLAGVETRAFTIDDANDLLSLEIQSDLNDAWVALDITMLKAGVPVARFGKGLSYYSGGSGEDAWSEGSRSERSYFKVTEPGSYTLEVSGEGGTGNSGSTPQNRPLNVTLREGVIVSRYFFMLALVAIIAAVWEPLRRFRFEARRWEAVEEDDDDE